MTSRIRILAPALLLAGAAAAEPEPAELEPTVVVAPAPAPQLAVGEFRIPRAELMARPLARTGEIVEAAPGLIATQHSGEGKANQYFLRGFNLDHGTDLSIRIDGMPVNMPTHGHGQGYADLNFLIPELLDGMLVRKGPYFADAGDFATAGALRLDLVNALERPFVLGTLGSFGYWRGLAAGSTPLGAGTLLAAGEVAGYQGPWQVGDGLVRLNGVLRYSEGTANDGFAITGMGYSGRWHATDQIPERTVGTLIGRFGTLDATDGGMTQRYSLSAGWSRSGDWGITRISAFGIRSSLDLFNDFTYVLDDPVRGDQFHQQDRRWIGGLDASQSYDTAVFGRPLQLRLGLQSRYDDIRLGLFRTEARNWLSTVRTDAVSQGTVGVWTDATLRLSPWFRGTIGLREDFMAGRVQSDLAANSGTARQSMLSPKLALAIGPFAQTEIFLNAGTGFHSNDLRGATIGIDPNDRLTPLSRVPLLVRAKGAEVGVQTRAIEGLDSRVALFVLTLGSEILFQGDAGTTEASRPSRRVGVEWTNRWRPLPWLALDADLAVTRARFTDTDPAGSRIPGAPNLILAAGATLGAETGWFGTARFRYFGARPLVEDNSVRSNPTPLLSARVGYGFSNGIRLQLEGFNLLNTRASQVDYYYVSRLAGEPPGGVGGVHFHPVEPLAVRFTAVVPL